MILALGEPRGALKEGFLSSELWHQQDCGGGIIDHSWEALLGRRLAQGLLLKLEAQLGWERGAAQGFRAEAGRRGGALGCEAWGMGRGVVRVCTKLEPTHLQEKEGPSYLCG